MLGPQVRQHSNVALSEAYRNLRRAMDCFDHCVGLVDTSVTGWRLIYTNLTWNKTSGKVLFKGPAEGSASQLHILLVNSVFWWPRCKHYGTYNCQAVAVRSARNKPSSGR
jgi:hypothetical protein